MAFLCYIHEKGGRNILTTYLPIAFRTKVTERELEEAEEIRLRAGQAMELVYAGGKIKRIGDVTAKQIREMLNYLTGYAPYAREEEMRQGFFTITGGHRIGISGHTSYSMEKSNMQADRLYDINAINMRIAHEVKDCAIEIIPWIRDGEMLYHTILFAPPGVGKTTYLRDCIRLLSKGEGGTHQKKEAGRKVAVVDERSEIAACYQGIPQNDLGPRTDVLDNCPKAIGMQMVLRSMSPDIIAVDELGGKEDFAAVAQAMKSGVTVLGTMHARSVEEIFLREEACRKWGKEGKMRFVGLKRKTPNMAWDKNRKVTVFDGIGRVLWEN